MNRGRIQAQGDGVEKSSAWATEETIYKHHGIGFIDNVEHQLTNPERTEREYALQRARQFVNSAPVAGVFSPLKKTFKRPQHRSIRIDVEVIIGVAFLTQVEQENG